MCAVLQNTQSEGREGNLYARPPPPGCPAGELGSLEEVVKEFVATGCITPVMLHELWGIADKAHEALARGAVGAER